MMQLTEKQKSEGWSIVKFGDVAQEVKASTKDPLSKGIERYIGLEHIDPESLRLARWGSIAKDNPTFTKKFSAGDILFGRRRAYLKKAAVAEFDGICSGDIIVIAPKGDILVPDLLPFIVQSEPFFDWAVKHSAGGLSPRTKFKSLAEFEFPLPPHNRQEEIVKLLQGIEDVRKDNNNSQTNFVKVKRVIIQNILKSDYKNMSLRDIAEVIASPVSKKSVKGEPPVQLCNYMDVYSNNKIHSQIPFMQATASTSEISRYTLQKGDVVITKDSEDPHDIAIPSFISEQIENLVCGYHLVILRPKNNFIEGRYLFHLLNSHWARHRFYPYAQGTTRYGIVSDAYEKIKIPVPNLDKQCIYADILDSLNDQFEIVCNRDNVYSSIQRKIIDKELLGKTA